jgi:diadenosine tetraphosphate (Ap4A) HIT family hydrolase
MSCNADVLLYRGLNRRDPPSDPELAKLKSSDCIIHQTEHTNVWIDAKGRRALVFTPKRHVERVSELAAAEWIDLLAAVAKFAAGATRAVINHGALQNHAHLHLKLFYRTSGDMPAESVAQMRVNARLYKAVEKGARMVAEEGDE